VTRERSARASRVLTIVPPERSDRSITENQVSQGDVGTILGNVQKDDQKGRDEGRRCVPAVGMRRFPNARIIMRRPKVNSSGRPAPGIFWWDTRRSKEESAYPMKRCTKRDSRTLSVRTGSRGRDMRYVPLGKPVRFRSSGRRRPSGRVVLTIGTLPILRLGERLLRETSGDARWPHRDPRAASDSAMGAPRDRGALRHRERVFGLARGIGRTGGISRR
jgi:hypothetical protein